LDRLDRAGHVGYVVGGSVRDFLLGRKKTKDHDIATSAGPDELCALFPDAVTVGKAFGVIKVPVPGEPMLEIATFRKDLEYEDHRHPQAVVFTGPEEDAQRRDFTVNGLFYDPKTRQILDAVSGLEDLKAGVIRAIGDPMERFREDALRLLRAVRFTTSLGFSLDPATADAVRARARLISKVSAERIRDEMTAMVLGPRPDLALQLLSDLGLLAQIFPELEALRKVPEWWKRALETLAWVARHETDRSFSLGWASLLHVVEEKLPLITQAFRFSNEDAERVRTLVVEEPKVREVFKMREATLQRFVRQDGFEDILALHRAVASATDGNLVHHEFASAKRKAVLTQGTTAKLVSGEDLIQLGFSPGPRFTEILRAVEDLALENKLQSKEQALEYVIKHYVE